jgi:GNAT superfamily N-acetyltransferase
MSISKTETSELVEVMYLMRVCSIDMNSMGCMFWNFMNNQIPDLISKGNVFKYKKNEAIIGIIVLNAKNAEEYNLINWEYINGNIIPIRLLVHPKWREKGICMELLAFAEQYAKDNKFNGIRLDANANNNFAINIVEKAQYKKAGELHLPFHAEPIVCFEKKI